MLYFLNSHTELMVTGGRAVSDLHLALAFSDFTAYRRKYVTSESHIPPPKTIRDAIRTSCVLTVVHPDQKLR